MTRHWYGLAERAVFALLVVGCGDPNVVVDEGQSGSAGGLESVGASLSATGTSEPSKTTGTTTGTTTRTTPSGDTTSGTTSGTASVDDGTTDTTWGMEPDLPPYPEACVEPDPLVLVTVAESPEGPLGISDAWYQVDYCSGLPHVILYRPPSVEFGPDLELDVGLSWDFEGGYPLMGVYATRASGGLPEGTIEFLDPYQYAEIGVPDASKRLHAQIEIHDQGWDLSVEVDLVYCGFGDCYCPCR